MAERRTLVEALQTPEPPLDPEKAKEFVYGKSAPKEPVKEAAPKRAISGVPINTRMRVDYATALKQASLDREMKGLVPYTMRDIIEEVIGPWLKSNGYLK